MHGVPLWGTLVAVAQGATILAGAVYCAAVDELVAAAPGLGNPRRSLTTLRTWLRMARH